MKIRNIGISAHIDSGKTTLSERILFYTNKISLMHEVKGKDGKGATMDFMDLERERGITIGSAVTNCEWKGYSINLIDTPGHVDFTIEVERALRVLDGSVLVLCAVGGVQSQSVTVNRQMDRYRVPRIAFINKCDRIGANPLRVAGDLKEKLNLNPVLLQIPIGLESSFTGLVDLVRMKAVYFEGEKGEDVRVAPIPAEYAQEGARRREEMLDAASLASEELTGAMLAGKVTEDLVLKALREGALSLKLVPVLMGSAYRNKGVQLLLDAVADFLPDPSEKENRAVNLDNGEESLLLSADPDKPAVALAFKLEESRYGQLTHLRLYQGRIRKGDELLNTRLNRKVRIGRLIRMHADEMEEIPSAAAGELVAIFGIDCVSGDTFTHPSIHCSMTSMFVPEPVISMSVAAPDTASGDVMSRALNRFAKEDPTFRSFVDPESKQTVIMGMGELHLEIYVERIRREYNVRVATGRPQVAFREAITQRADFNYLHKKQTGGAGQFARVEGFIEPCADNDFLFVNKVRGGAIPTEYLPAVERAFEKCMKKGRLIEFPVVRFSVTVIDGASHAVDSSDIAFQQAAIGAFNDAYVRARPVILEPVMKVSAEGPSEFQGAVLATLVQRRGIILTATDDGRFSRVDAEVPLAEMFGYSTVIRSATQGKAEFTMEFLKYARVPKDKSEELIEAYQEKKKKG